MKRYMKFSNNYRLAAVCFAAFIATAVVTAILGAILFTSPASALVFGMTRTVAAMVFLFMPTVICAALLFGVNFWFTAEGKRMGFGWYGVEAERAEKTYF